MVAVLMPFSFSMTAAETSAMCVSISTGCNTGRSTVCRAPADRVSGFAARNAPRVGPLESRWQDRIRHILVAHRAQEAVDRCGTDGSRAAVRGGGERAAMDHGIAHFHTGGITVDEDAAHLQFQR